MLTLAIILGTVIETVYGQSRIVGGQDAPVSQHPYQISLQNAQGSHFCGGFMISKSWVVTAAHCVYQATPSTIRTYQIRAGSTFYNQSGQLVKIQKAIVHPNFSISTINNDIALLRLSSPITVGTAASAILPRQNQKIADGTVLKITGWGATKNGGNTLPNHLKVVEVPTVNRNTCQNKYRGSTYKVTNNMFCAGYLGTGGKDSCSGDSGGPAARGRRVLGVVSWGVNCGDPNYPGVYTQVSRYRDWIKQTSGV